MEVITFFSHWSALKQINYAKNYLMWIAKDGCIDNRISGDWRMYTTVCMCFKFEFE